MTTEAAPEIGGPHPEQSKRFWELLYFFTKKAGCCMMCGMDFAIAVIEKEAGRTWVVQECFAPERKCKERAREAWKLLPKATGS
jgi:hypothetical protein